MEKLRLKIPFMAQLTDPKTTPEQLISYACKGGRKSAVESGRKYRGTKSRDDRWIAQNWIKKQEEEKV